jgi:hypothetical protein
VIRIDPEGGFGFLETADNRDGKGRIVERQSRVGAFPA